MTAEAYSQWFIASRDVDASSAIRAEVSDERQRWPDHVTAMRLMASAGNRLRMALRRMRGVDPYGWTRIEAVPDLRRIGNVGCQWVVPESRLKPDTVCYCVGAGEDISFDIALAREFQCEVHTFDPTPKAIAYVASLQGVLPTRLTFHSWGVWGRDERVRFYAPKESAHVSYSIVNLQKTDQFLEADCKRLKTTMCELGHRSLGLLKLDIEGAEYQVIESMITDGVRPVVLTVEFDELHHPLDDGARSRIKTLVERLVSAGYVLVSADGSNYTFVNSVDSTENLA